MHYLRKQQQIQNNLKKELYKIGNADILNKSKLKDVIINAIIKTAGIKVTKPVNAKFNTEEEQDPVNIYAIEWTALFIPKILSSFKEARKSKDKKRKLKNSSNMGSNIIVNDAKNSMQYIKQIEPNKKAVESAKLLAKGKEPKVKGVKVWLHSGNSNGRPEHIALNNKAVPIGKKFNVGGELMSRPGNGSIKNTAYCNCSIYVKLDKGA